jgi:hypothetical protein
VATKVITVSGNANQAVANDDFEGFVREANKADLLEKGFSAKTAAVEKEVVVEEPKKEAPKVETKQSEKRPNRLGYKDLRDRVKELEAENLRLKTPKTEEEVKVETEKKAEPEKLRARPKSDDQVDGKPRYKDWSEYEDDLLAWNREKIFAELDERSAKKTQEAKIEAVNQTIEQSWKERVNKSRELHADYDEVALDDKTGPGRLIQPGSLVDEWIMDSEHGAELLYYFGKNESELRKFENVSSWGKTVTERRAAVRRALVKLEDKITVVKDSTDKEKEAKPSEEEAAKKAADEVRVTRTPKPSSEVGGRGNSLPDPVAAAIADGSDDATRRYIEEQNRRDIRARFGDTRR